MAFFEAPEPREHWDNLYQATMLRRAELRGRVDRGDERPLARLAEATVNVGLLASACAGIDAPEAYTPRVAADVLMAAEHGATVAAWLVELALVAPGRELRYPAHEWRRDALALAAARSRQDRASPLALTATLVHNVATSLAEAITESEREPLRVSECGAMALADLIELYVRIRAAVAGIPTCR